MLVIFLSLTAFILLIAIIIIIIIIYLSCRINQIYLRSIYPD